MGGGSAVKEADELRLCWWSGLLVRLMMMAFDVLITPRSEAVKNFWVRWEIMDSSCFQCLGGSGATRRFLQVDFWFLSCVITY